jgi:hypothetical protein
VIEVDIHAIYLHFDDKLMAKKDVGTKSTVGVVCLPRGPAAYAISY